MMIEAFGKKSVVPTAEELLNLAIHYLWEGGEQEEAELLEECSLELGEIKAHLGTVSLIDVTLRCRRQLVERLRAPETWREESQLRRRIRTAIRESLPSGYDIATFEARLGVMRLCPSRVPGSVAGKTQLRSREAAASSPALVERDGAEPTIVAGPDILQFVERGRLGHLPDFRKVRVDGELFDLSGRQMARCCLRLLVERQAFDEKSALHFDEVIHPHVKQECGCCAAEPKIHHYFNGKIERLREKLVKPVGRKGKFYLAVN